MLDARVAIIGATGLVGREALAILSSQGVPASMVVALGSERSAGTTIAYGSSRLPVALLSETAFEDVDLALFCADADTATRFAPLAVAAGAIVVDNSSAFRMDATVPLVVPEVNAHLLDAEPAPRLIANPNCSTIILLSALEPIRRAAGISRVIVSTYQAVSGAGAAGLEALWSQTRALAGGGDAGHGVFPVRCAMNVFTHESALDDATGLNAEETKIIQESRRIWEGQGTSILPTCVRVPVERAHSQSITFETREPIRLTEIETLLRSARHVEYREANGKAGRGGGGGGGEAGHPTPLDAAGRDPIVVGRLRADPSDSNRRFSIWVCADQLRKGAALNAIQIGQRVLGATAAAPGW